MKCSITESAKALHLIVLNLIISNAFEAMYNGNWCLNAFG